MAHRFQLITSALAFAVAVLLSTTAHEFGHALAALALHAHPVVHPFSVDPGVHSNHDHLITALAGPLVSLVLGIVVALLPRRGPAALRLLQFWFATISLGNLFAYLMTGPFHNAGDINAAVHYAHAPTWLAFIGFVVGVAGLIAVGWLASGWLVVMVDPADELAAQLRALGLFAWLLGAALSVVVSIGAFDFDTVGLFEAFGVLTAGVFIFVVRSYLRRRPDLAPGTRRLAVGLPDAGLLAVLLVVVVLLRVLVLAPGLRLG
jgi:hypothetical protein